MRIFFIILCCICFCINTHAQILPHKAPSQNKHWLDSMKRIINKGFELNTNDKNNWKKQLTYVNTCTNLGRYYEWAYDKHYVKNMSLALKYYNKVIDLGRFPDEPIYFKALAIRTNIYRKLADIYFKGKGVKRDKKLSLEMALKGIGSNTDLVDFYSARYIGRKSRIIYSSKINIEKGDTIFTFKTTPFATHAQILYFNILNEKFRLISEIFKTKSKVDSLEMKIEMISETSYRGQSYANYCTKYIRDKFVNKFKLNPDQIITNVEVGEIDEKIFTITIQKKGTF